jgi:hypothetical protein
MRDYARRRDYRISWIPRYDLEAALWRCSKRDRELILGWWDAEQRWIRNTEAGMRRDHQRYRDLEFIVRDQRRHIANLEAQLLPYLQAEPVDQEVLL